MHRPLRRWIVGSSVALGLFLGFTAPAGAAELPVEGSYAGSAMLTQEGCVRPGSGNIGHTTVATGTISPLGETQVDGLTCLGPGSGGSTELFGSFTFTGADGSITGEMTGLMDGSCCLFFEHMTVVITGGTGDFEGATGTLSVEGVFLNLSSVEGTVTGSITVPPNTPTSKADCMNGGWRDFEDENGEPFKNQGDCIAWVNHNT
jgi:hypothetical protein